MLRLHDFLKILYFEGSSLHITCFNEHIFFFNLRFLHERLESKPSELRDYSIVILCNACKFLWMSPF